VGITAYEDGVLLQDTSIQRMPHLRMGSVKVEASLAKTTVYVVKGRLVVIEALERHLRNDDARLSEHRAGAGKHSILKALHIKLNEDVVGQGSPLEHVIEAPDGYLLDSAPR